MNRYFLVIETFFTGERQNYYYVKLPAVGEKGFYRAVSSYNAFFNSGRNPHANVTERRQFTSDDAEGIEIRKSWHTAVAWDQLQTFETIWDFYKFIGYDYKTRKYKSGEILKIFDGHCFILPKRKK